ncbi:hypothetical protein PRUPE_6G105000 [Prunus persica]|uniref:Glycine-rich protein n=1 Tax=Prunus persica TaxID=3760 RepID=A0A251NNA6_PRUPE|nr:hypothetical protein PRUPE_6G105000 [Prunus persica]
MKLLALALILMVASSSFAAGKASNEHDGYLHGRELGEEAEVGQGGYDGYPGSSVNNHHHLPWQDFNSKGGSDNDNGGG